MIAATTKSGSHRDFGILSGGAILLALALALPATASADLFSCFSPLILPEVDIKNATLEEALEYVRFKSKELDTLERDPAKRGVNIVLKPPLSPVAKLGRISIQAKDMKAVDLMKLLGRMTQMQVQVEPYAVVFAPKGSPEPLYVRTYQVPPEFRTITPR